MQRKTSQRTAIIRALKSADRPLTPQEVLDLATGDAAGLGIATVYRNLKALVAAGTIQAIGLPGETTARYELCGKKHHHHFHCRSCQQVYEVEGCPGNIAPIVPKGFQMHDHELIIYGTCAECGKKRRA